MHGFMKLKLILHLFLNLFLVVFILVMKISSLWLIVTLLGICEQQIESAVVPPPWSDPYSNPCATQPGGWQLLYWRPLKKCFKIFTVCYKQCQ